MTTATLSPPRFGKNLTRLEGRTRQAAEETYLEVKPVILAAVRDIYKRFGGNFDDILSDANTAFLEAYESWEPEKSSFTSWLRLRIFSTTVNNLRHSCRDHARYEHVDDSQLTRPTGSFDPKSLLEELTEDARIVVQLTLETPAELEAVVRAKGGQPRNLRSSLRSYLAEMGWTACRIAESFNEVRRVLAE